MAIKDMREIEVKLKVNDLGALEKKLLARGCILSEPLHQHDTIYSQKGSVAEFESAKEGDIILRIRHENNKFEFNLKQQRSSESDNIEYETEIENAETMDKILRVFGWLPEIEVKKVRRKGKLEKYEICLDRVEGLGDYVELEKLAPDDADPAQVREELLDILEKLGLPHEDEEIRGYDTLLYHLRKQDVKK